MYNCVWYYCTYPYGLSLYGWHALLCIANNRHSVTITTHAIKRHFLIWMTTVRQPAKRRRSFILTSKYTFICVYWWTRQRIHNTLIVVDRYLRLMGDKTIPDSAEPRLESFYPPFVAGIDLPHQGVVDSYNPCWGLRQTTFVERGYWVIIFWAAQRRIIIVYHQPVLHLVHRYLAWVIIPVFCAGYCDYPHYADSSTNKMLVRYMLPSVCLRLRLFSQLSFIQYMGLCVFSLPNSSVMIVRMCTSSYYHHQIGSMNH